MGEAERDRRRYAALRRSLEAIETDEVAPEDDVAMASSAADADRQQRGLPLLRHDETYPEEEFYRRARALGFRRIRR